jgi:hypothetical protein
VDGGVDDRFDFILPSTELAPRLIKGSYTHVGNDGVPRLNSGIDNPVNKKYSPEMVDALKCGSDHMPIYVDMVLGDVPASVDNADGQDHITVYDGAVIVPPSAQTTYVYAIDGTLVNTVTESSFATRIDDLPRGVYAVYNGRSTRLVTVVR